MRKKLLTALIVILIIASVSIGITYAIYTANSALPKESLTVNIDGYTEVSNEYELRLATVDVDVNSDLDVSDYRARIRLMANINLTSNLVIKRDVAIDLGGFTLDLKTFSMAVTHSYYGETIITKGDVIGSITIDTPLATVSIDDVITCDILTYDQTRVINEIKSEVDKKIASYYVSNIELMFKYRHYKIDFLWSSSHPDIVNDLGIVNLDNLVNNVKQNVTLTCKLKNADGLEIGELSKVTVIMSQDTDKIERSKAILDTYLSRYSSPNTLSNNLSLPKIDSYLGTTYSYSLIAGSDFATLDDTTIKIKANGEIKIKASVSYLSSTIDYEYTLTVKVISKEEIASEVMDKFFPWMFIYNRDTLITSFPTATELTNYGIKNINYKFYKDNQLIDTIYAIRDNDTSSELYVLNLPELEDKIYMEVTLTFENSIDSLTRQTRIYYTNASAGGGGSSGSDIYAGLYNALGEILLERTNDGITYTTFFMPTLFFHTPISYYIIVGTEWLVNYEDIITIEIKEESSYFKIDTTKIKHLDEIITIGYKFGGEATAYARQHSFILQSIIQPSDFTDVNLYNIVLEEYSTDLVLTVAEANAYRENYLLVNTPITSLKGIEFLRGTSKFNFDRAFKNSSDFNSLGLEYLAKLTDLSHLSLKNNNMNNAKLMVFNDINKYFIKIIQFDIGNIATDGTFNQLDTLDNFPSYNTLTTLMADNVALKDISSLKNLPKLTTINLTNNKISNFRALLEVKNLQEVFIAENIITTLLTTNALSADYLFNHTEGQILYGSKGIYNTTTFILLSARGVKIYNIDSKTYFIADDGDKIATSVLESIVYYKYSNGQISVPKSIKINANDPQPYLLQYNVAYLPNVTVVDGGSLSINYTHAQATTLPLFVRVTVEGKTVYRLLEVTYD